MVKVQLVKDLVAKGVAFAVAQREDKGSAFDDEEHKACSTASLGNVRKLLHELMVKLKEGLVDENLEHLIEVASLVQERSPGLDLVDQVITDILHTLRTTMTVKDCEETDKLPLASANVFFNDKSILHSGPVARVKSSPAVEAPQLEEQVAHLEPTVERQRVNLLGGYSAEDHLVRNESFSYDLCYWLLWGKEQVRVSSKVVRLPADFNGKVSQGLIEEGQMKSPIYLVLGVPLLGLPTHPCQLFLVPFLEREVLVALVVSCEELGKSANSVVLEQVAQTTYVIGHADLLDFVDWLSMVKADYKGPNCQVLAVPYVNPLLGNVHPGSAFASEVKHIKVLESVELKLGVLLGQSSPFDLQRQSVELRLSCSEDLSILVGSYVQKPILEDALCAVEHVLHLHRYLATCSSLISVMLSFWPMVSKLSFLMKSILYLAPFALPSFCEAYLFPAALLPDPAVVPFLLADSLLAVTFVCFIVIQS